MRQTLINLVREQSSLNETVFQIANNHLALSNLLMEKEIITPEEMDEELEALLAQLLNSPNFAGGINFGTIN